MRKNIIVINGTGGSGKDTFVEFASKYSNVINFSSIDIIKELARNFGWTGGKTEKDRKMLSDLKKVATEYNDLPFNTMCKAIYKFYESNYDFMFIHIREPEEIKRVVEKFDAKTLLIKRVGLDNITTNYSDANVEHYDYDFVIINSNLKDLEKKAQEFLISLSDVKKYKR